MEYKDYYAILGVDKNTSDDDLKKAYRRLARKYHPDVSKEKDAENKFKDVQEAYEVLKDPEKRAAYDQLGANWKAGQEFRPPPNWGEGRGGADHRAYYSNGQFSEEEMGGFSDFFSNLFGHGAQFRQGRASREDFGGFQQRGQDQQAKITISLEDAFRGTTRSLQLQMPEFDPVSGQMRAAVKTLKVTIPAGAEAGQKLRLAGQGGPGMGGAPAGDLYLEIEIAPHPLYTLQGKDVYLTLPVTPWEAALGSEIKVPTLAGAVGLKLAAGAQSGQKLRLKGRGMPGKPDAGDQYAVVEIKTPVAQTAEQRQLYENMAKMMPYNPRSWTV